MSEATGCEYREHKGVLQCKKLCDPGQTMCPHHLLLTQAKGRPAQADRQSREPRQQHPEGISGMMEAMVCEQCDGTGQCKPGMRCPCREEDDAAEERRSRMGIVAGSSGSQEPKFDAGAKVGTLTPDEDIVWSKQSSGRCPYRADIETPPNFMADLAVSRGYPVPWFVEWFKGEPEFRATSMYKAARAVREKLCWTCGKPMFSEKVFVIGPMCAINRISSEPPSHRSCATYAAINCPFLSRPNMVRRTNDFPEGKLPPAGIMVERNPGVTLLWFTNSYSLIQSPKIESASAGEGILFKLGRATKTEWYREGRKATRAEILESIDSGLPLLHQANEMQGMGEAGRIEVERLHAEALKLVPR